jgi:hypothetical protein
MSNYYQIYGPFEFLMKYIPIYLVNILPLIKLPLTINWIKMMSELKKKSPTLETLFILYLIDNKIDQQYQLI